MHAKVDEIVAGLRSEPPPLDSEEVRQAGDLLEWLGAEHFTFLGYREYKLERQDDDDFLRAIPGTGLGILRADQEMSESFGRLPESVKAHAREKTLLVLAKANSRATVHRPAYLDYVGVKTFDASGEVTGERRFLGLLSSAAYTESILRIPLVMEKAQAVLKRSGFDPRSHAGKALMDTLETYPRDELLHTPVDELAPMAEAAMHARERRAVRMFIRKDTYGRYVSVLVYLPRDRYNTGVRERFAQLLHQRLGAESVEFNVSIGESTTARVHFVVHLPKGEGMPEIDIPDLERRLAEASRSWRDDFTAAVIAEYGEEAGGELGRRYLDSFPEAYKEDFSPRTASVDLGRLEAIQGDEGIDHSLYQDLDAASGEARLKLYRIGPPLSLSEILPTLSSMGVEVVDERPYALVGLARPSHIYEFGLHYEGDPPGQRPGAVPGRNPGGLGGLQRDRRLQRAGARCPADLAAGDAVAVLREVPQAGQLAVRARLHRARARQQHRHHPLAGAAVRGEVRSEQHAGRRRPGPDRAADLARGPDRGRARRGGKPRPRPDPEVVPHPDQGHAAHQLLPARRRRAAQSVHLTQARAVRDPGAARAAAAVRDLRLLAAGRGGAPALRRGRPGRVALVGPPRRLPHRGPGAGQGADGQEHGDRARRRQGRVLLQAAARPLRPRGVAERGHRLLQDLHLRPARHHRQPDRVRERAPAGRGPPRRRRQLPRGRRRQGHRDVLGHRQRRGHRLRLLARRRVRQRRLGRVRPQGDGHHRARRLGVRAAALPGDGHRLPDRGLLLRRHRRHVRRRLRQRPALLRAHPAARGVRPPRHLHRPRPGPRNVVRRAQATLRAAPVQLAGLRPGADLRGRRRVPAGAEVDQAQRADPPGARDRRRRGGDDPRRADARHPAGSGRPAVERRHRHLRQGPR